MENIKIGFSTSRAFFSWLIRVLTKSKSSHAFILATLDGVEVVVGAEQNGLVIQTYDRFLEKNQVLYVYDFQGKIDVAGEWFIRELDTGYDYLSILGFVWMLFKRNVLRMKNAKNPWGSPWRYTCSEVATKLLQMAKYPGAETLDIQSTTPQDLWDLLKKTEGK